MSSYKERFSEIPVVHWIRRPLVEQMMGGSNPGVDETFLLFFFLFRDFTKNK